MIISKDRLTQLLIEAYMDGLASATSTNSNLVRDRIEAAIDTARHRALKIAAAESTKTVAPSRKMDRPLT